jgi:hypothetical protein
MRTLTLIISRITGVTASPMDMRQRQESAEYLYSNLLHIAPIEIIISFQITHDLEEMKK